MTTTPRFALLRGARSNAGDHLIGDRIIKLLQAAHPDAELLDVDRWKPLDDRLDELNAMDAVLLAGGPGFVPDIHPRIYPLVDDLDALRPPLVAFGLGWKGHPGDEHTVQTYRFDDSSRPLLDRLARQPVPVSCRDHATARVVRAAGVPNTLMTGDPAWYDPEALGTPFSTPEAIGRIALSTAAHPRYTDQTLRLAHALTDLFPEARIEAVFHHGWTPRDGLPETLATRFASMRDRLEDGGVPCVSIAGDLDAMVTTYRDTDLHIGYRLHAHLLRLSARRPSFLLHEDGRGIGADTALGTPGVTAWERTPLAMAAKGMASLGPLEEKRVRAVRYGVRARPEAATEAAQLAHQEVQNGYQRLRGVADVIDAHHKTRMRPFVEGLGEG